jgi:hypothetical protein
VHAIDENYAPVADATIWLANSPRRLADLYADATLPKATTDAAGNATFVDLAPAQYRIHVDHPTLVYSHQLQDDANRSAAIAPQVPATSEVTIQLATPYVFAVQVDGARFTCSFRGTNAPFTSASNGDGQDAMRRIDARLKTRFPDAQTMVMLRERESEQSRKRREEALQSGRRNGYEATVWVTGRVPWTGPIEFVPFPLFERPLTLGLGQLPMSRDWATLVVNLRDAMGTPLDAAVTLNDPPLSGRRSTFFSVAVRDATPLQVPVGTYEWRTDDLLLQELLHRAGPFTAVAGASVSLQFGHQYLWSRCRFVAVGGGAGMGTLTLDSTASQLHGTRMVTSPTAGYECWVPEGSVVGSITVNDPETGRSWRGKTTAIATGGTISAPQGIVLRMRLENR